MSANLTAKASVTIAAPAETVWSALTDPAQIREYMFGSRVSSDWQVGSPITWKGEMNGKSYEDKGKVLQVDRPSLLQYSHGSAAGAPHVVTIRLSGSKDRTEVRLEQDHNRTEEARRDSQDNWSAMLKGLKQVVER